MDISQELKEKARACETAEELVALAKENDFELSAEEAELYLQDFAEGEVADEELNNVAGGQEGCAKPASRHEQIYWKNEKDVQFIFKRDDIVEAFPAFCSHHTATCKVVNLSTAMRGNEWVDVYWLEKLKGVKTPFTKGWYTRSEIEK